MSEERYEESEGSLEAGLLERPHRSCTLAKLGFPSHRRGLGLILSILHFVGHTVWVAIIQLCCYAAVGS